MFDYEETVDFLNDFKDMCNEQDCSKCPLNCGFLLRNDPETVIKILQKWNEDNGNYQREDFDKAVKSGVEQAMKECELTIGMTVKEAVERQTPKKVVTKQRFLLDKFCPNCDENLTNFGCYSLNSWKYRYCAYCGQALDWGKNG